MIDDFDLQQIAAPLQEWFAGHARVLPWRENPEPYEVWVSEIMLQQTRVEAVRPYYERFMKALPDVRALAGCPEERLLKLWEGLGYYNRVRNLKAAAVQVMEEYGGVIPCEYGELLKLKGIGRYTAGAIASIAYEKPVPAVDGNVLRVISRVTADEADIGKQSVRTHMEEKLAALMQKPASGAEKIMPRIFNQALMELGATVCVPNGAPYCTQCPWQRFCRAKQEGSVDRIPVKKKAKERKCVELTVFVVRDGDKVALHRRSSRGLLAGMYELPNREGHMQPEEAVSHVREMGYAPLRIQPLERAKHIFSHVEWNMIGYVISVAEPEEEQAGGKNSGQKNGDWFFVDAQEAKERYAIPAAFARYAEYMNIPIGPDAKKAQEPIT